MYERDLVFQMSLFHKVMLNALDNLCSHYFHSACNVDADFVAQYEALGNDDVGSRILIHRLTNIATRKYFDLLGIKHAARI